MSKYIWPLVCVMGSFSGHVYVGQLMRVWLVTVRLL